MPSAIAPLETPARTCLPRLRSSRDLRGPARDGGRVEAAALVGDERRADLDDQRFRLPDHLASSRATAFITAAQPSPLRADTLNHGPFQRNAASAATRASASSTASILLNTSQRGLRYERLVVLLQLRSDGACVARRIGVRVGRRDVHEVQQQPRAREVSQELVPEPGALGGALDQPRDVGEHEAAPRRHAHHAERRVERGERIVGHLGARARHRADQASTCPHWAGRAAPRRRAAQLEREVAVSPWLAARELARRAVRRST